MYDRLLYFNRFTRWLLACIVGLTFSNFAFANAGAFPTRSDAYLQCLTDYNNTVSYFSSAETSNAKYAVDGGGIMCVENKATKRFICQVNALRYAKVANPVPQEVTANPRCQTTWTSPGNTTRCSNCGVAYTYTTVDEICGNDEFESTSMRAPTANGTGNVCQGSCAYSVSVGYNGTWPTGNVYYTYTGLNRECTAEDEEPTEEELDPDTPLDIDGETPKPGPEPGDGEKPSSSGGGTCDDPPKCQGDAIQCNILYQSWANRCKGGSGGEGGEGGEGTDLTGVENKLQTLINQNNEIFSDDGKSWGVDDGDWGGLKATKTLSVNDLDTQGLGFPRSCNFFEEKTISVGVTSFTIDFNSTGVCNIFTWSGYLLVALASFAGCMILIRD